MIALGRDRPGTVGAGSNHSTTKYGDGGINPVCTNNLPHTRHFNAQLTIIQHLQHAVRLLSTILTPFLVISYLSYSFDLDLLNSRACGLCSIITDGRTTPLDLLVNSSPDSSHAKAIGAFNHATARTWRLQ